MAFTAPQSTPATPHTTVSQPITFDRNQLKATPQEISRDRSYNTWTGAGIGAVLGASVSFGMGLGFSRRYRPNLHNTLLATAAFSAIGAGIGHALKTGAEQRSEALMSAANAGPNFGTHLKEEMRRREHSAFWNGVITGSCLFL